MGVDGAGLAELGGGAAGAAPVAPSTTPYSGIWSLPPEELIIRMALRVFAPAAVGAKVTSTVQLPVFGCSGALAAQVADATLKSPGSNPVLMVATPLVGKVMAVVPVLVSVTRIACAVSPALVTGKTGPTIAAPPVV